MEFLFEDKHAVEHRIGVMTATVMLWLWLDRKMHLTRAEYDQLAGFLYILLERCNDEQYRLK